MFAGKILVILYAPTAGEGAMRSMQNALLTASRPENLRFALPSYAHDDLAEEIAAQGLPAAFFDYLQGLPAAAGLLEDETHFLLLMGDAVFSAGWDSYLFAHLRQDRTLLTASVWHRDDTGDAEVCLPALREPFEEFGIAIGRGLPLVCPAGPVRTLLADPAQLFGESGFLRVVKPEITGISYSAFLAGYMVQLLEEARIRPVGKLPPRRLCRVTPTVTPGTSAARFEQLCGIRPEKRYLTPKIRLGLMETDTEYPQKAPAAAGLKTRLRELTASFRREDLPMAVTAFTDQPSPRQEPASYYLHFGFLKKLHRLPLTVFTGGELERAVRASHPNTLSFPERAIPRCEGMTAAQHMRRLKPEMLWRVAQRHPELATVAWVDFDILPHPLPEGAMPDFRPLYDGKIHFAAVDGEPDLSFILIPTSKLRSLAREAALLTSLDRDLHQDFSEESLWKRLYDKNPAAFVVHRMPRRQLLFLSLFDPAVLSRQITVHLNKENAAPETRERAEEEKP